MLSLVKFPLAESQNSESTGKPGLDGKDEQRGEGNSFGKTVVSWSPGYRSVLMCFHFLLLLLIPVKLWGTLMRISDDYKFLLHFSVLRFR